MTRILVTGATGFVGRSLLPYLKSGNYHIRALSRQPKTELSPDIEWLPYDLIAARDFDDVLSNVDTVIHLASRVHQFDQNGETALNEYRRANTEVTRRLAEEAANKGVRRFIYISTIKVNGGKTSVLANGEYQRFTETDTPAPEDPYAISKYEAEEALKEECSKSEMEYVILRPPLIYGPWVKANFLHLIATINKGIPLPLASVRNCRSLMYVENLSQIIECCIKHPGAANRLFLVSDYDTSLPDLVRRIGNLLGKRLPLLPCPVPLLKFAGFMIGKQAVIRRLTESLVIENTRIKAALSWEPGFSLEDGLRNTLTWYKVFNHIN
ncbi:MAG: NAD-dependent epimerase/dehydratase family protein [Gammaproteobacteria bacterium]|nr:NAD-dependent epimerase/dehydratase family protein [Gammaproteobacteria bacterium]NIO63531.1 NAD-dependent epimerase/dehydratase family protein [Gammaproteobacteria bacterium]NIT14564.1 NAD-dependent epimerase/dehydratase family protein [Candidatus Dadabacteria bacterium]NIT41050.1 NAD-dependent epimerase/dehydratase family protein [Gammaproteobacteria bacterium]